MIKKILLLFLVLAQTSSPSFAYVFNSDPRTWSDRDVESFLFLSQVQKQTALTKGRNLCIDISEPVPGGKQTMRIISKVGDNKDGGLFQNGKSEIAKGSAAESDMNTIKKIVEMSSGYQQAIMDYDESSGVPTVRFKAETKDYMTAEVIGYTDGQGITGAPSGALDGQGKNYSSNKQLGKLRADYLADQLDLANDFAKVNKTSIESESTLRKNEYKDIRACATWRTAEVRMTFQTGSKATDDATWAMSTKMASSQQRLMMQYEAAKQVQEALKTVNDGVLHVNKPWPKTMTPPAGSTDPYTEMSPEYATYCSAIMDEMKKFDSEAFNGCKTGSRSCYYRCPNIGNVYPIGIAGALQGGAFASNVILFADKDNPNPNAKGTIRNEDAMKSAVKNSEAVRAALKKLTDARDAAKLTQLKKSFPECAKDPAQFKDLLALVTQVEPHVDDCKTSSPYYSVDAKNTCAQAAILKAADGTGMSGKLMKCISMKRVMNSMYSADGCKTGASFNKVTFPHMNAHLGCKFCGNGWNAKDGVASFTERYDGKVTVFHDHHTTLDTPTYQSLQSPSIHEIADCADCLCTNKNEKLKKVFLVEEASPTNNIVQNINKTSCYCTPPVAPSCGVGPQGATGEAKYSSLGQKYFYDSCMGKFVAVTNSKSATDQKGAQIAALVNQFNSCGSNPGKVSCDMSKVIADVNGMMCESQKYKMPTDDPVVDCSKEEAMSGAAVGK